MDELLEQLLAQVNDAYDKSRGYIVYDLLKAFSIVMAGYNDDLESIKALQDVDNLTNSMLEVYVYQRKGIERKRATYAVGTVTVTGNGTVNIGDLFETASGIRFAATETKTITGTGTVAVKCTQPGAIGNVPANQIKQMPVTISGITGVNNQVPTAEGYEAETDDSLRQRYYVAVRSPGVSGNVAHYKEWALSVSGVGGVKVFPLDNGENTVGIVIIDSNKQPASAGLIADVQKYIDPESAGMGYGQAPIGCYVTVTAAARLEIEVTANVTRNPAWTEAQIQANITQALTNYLKGIAFVQDYASYAAIGNVIYEAGGVDDYAGLLINGGNINVSIGSKQVAVLGDVVITYA